MRRFWQGTARGGYVGHGETYLHPEDVLWWSKGGVLHGESPARIAFLKGILEEGPGQGLDPVARPPVGCEACAGRLPDYYLCYFGIHRPAEFTLRLPEESSYRVESVDTWDMKTEVVTDEPRNGSRVEFAGRPYMAVRITKRC